MTEWYGVETEYSPEGRPEYEQLFVDRDSEAVEHLNELYLEESYSGFSFRDAARNLPNTERIRRQNKGGLPSDENYPTTEDSYRWNEEILRSNGDWRNNVPFFEYKEIAVLFPQKRKGIELEELEEENPEIYIGDHISDKELREIADCETRDVVELLESIDRGSVVDYIQNNPQLQNKRLDRSVAVYGTDNVDDNEAEEFLWELAGL
jgi:hypothetical protein